MTSTTKPPNFLHLRCQTQFVKKQQKNSKNTIHKLHNRHTQDGEVQRCHPLSQGWTWSRRSVSTRFLPPYSVYRFALWSFLLGLGTRWGQAGEAVQVDFSVWLAGQSVGQLAVDMATDTCLLGPARLCCHLPGLRPLLQWPAGVRTQTGQRGCLKSRRAKEQAPPEDHLAVPATRSMSGLCPGHRKQRCSRLGRPLHHQ